MNETTIHPLPTRRATLAEIRDVERFTTTAPGGPVGRSAVTGLAVRETDDHVIVRLYSAHCLHGEYPIAKTEIITRERQGGCRCGCTKR